VIVGAVRVVVLDELVQDLFEVPGSGDYEVIEAFAAQRADEAFGDRVGAGCPHGVAEDADVGAAEDRVEGGGELAVPVADQEPELVGSSPRSMSRLRACWVTLWGSRTRSAVTDQG
jgi:hypothetical protein